MALSTIDYAERAERAGGGVYFVAEGDREYNTRIQKIIPKNRYVIAAPGAFKVIIVPFLIFKVLVIIYIPLLTKMYCFTFS